MTDKLEQVQEVESYETSGSALERALFRAFKGEAKWDQDHDTDPGNWSEAGHSKSKTDINKNAVDGNPEMEKLEDYEDISDITESERELFDFLSTLSEEELAELDESVLSRIGQSMKKGAKRGASAGNHIGGAVGRVAGSTYGTAVGAVAGATLGAAASAVKSAAKGTGHAVKTAYRQHRIAKYRAKKRAAMSESITDVRDVYLDEFRELHRDVSDLFESANMSNCMDGYKTREIVSQLRSIRDAILMCLPDDSMATSNEPVVYGEGFVLNDDTTVKLTEEDNEMIVSYLNQLDESVATKVIESMSKDRVGFESMYELIRSETKGSE